ncbi:hypothetical protein D9M68_880640 [compost metagenome]
MRAADGVAGFQPQRLLDVAHEGAEEVQENTVRLANTGQHIGVDQRAENDGRNTGLQGAAVDPHGDFRCFFQGVDEGQPNRLEIDSLELRKD